jgi:hypothetical protein
MIRKENHQQTNLFGEAGPGETSASTVENLLKIYDETWINDWYESKSHEEEYRKLGREKLREIIQKKGPVRYTSKTVTDPRQYLREVEKAGKQGYAVDDEEYIPGVRAVAAPLPSTTFPPAAIWVVGFTSTLDDQKVKMAIREIQEAAVGRRKFDGRAAGAVALDVDRRPPERGVLVKRYPPAFRLEGIGHHDL